MSPDLIGSRALVVGGGSGIGPAATLLLARDGASIRSSITPTWFLVLA